MSLCWTHFDLVCWKNFRIWREFWYKNRTSCPSVSYLHNIVLLALASWDHMHIWLSDLWPDFNTLIANTCNRNCLSLQNMCQNEVLNGLIAWNYSCWFRFREFELPWDTGPSSSFTRKSHGGRGRQKWPFTKPTVDFSGPVQKIRSSIIMS